MTSALSAILPALGVAVTTVNVIIASITKTLLHFVQIAFSVLPMGVHRILSLFKIYKSEVNLMLKKFYKAPCSFCLNARVCDDLTDSNDSSSYSVGKASKGFHMFVSSGNGSPVRIEVLQWDELSHSNFVIASYFPKYCPNCGRKLFEDYN